MVSGPSSRLSSSAVGVAARRLPLASPTWKVTVSGLARSLLEAELGRALDLLRDRQARTAGPLVPWNEGLEYGFGYDEPVELVAEDCRFRIRGSVDHQDPIQTHGLVQVTRQAMHVVQRDDLLPDFGDQPSFSIDQFRRPDPVPQTPAGHGKRLRPSIEQDHPVAQRRILHQADETGAVEHQVRVDLIG